MNGNYGSLSDGSKKIQVQYMCNTYSSWVLSCMYARQKVGTGAFWSRDDRFTASFR